MKAWERGMLLMICALQYDILYRITNNKFHLGLFLVMMTLGCLTFFGVIGRD